MSPGHPPRGRRVRAASLPPDHRCRVDDLDYETVGAWFADHVGHVPVQAAAGLDQYMRAYGCTFGVAFAALTAPGGPIIPVGPSQPKHAAVVAAKS